MMEGYTVRIGTVSGTLLSIVPPLLAQDIVRTIILGVIGAAVSFGMTHLLKWLLSPRKKT